MSYTLYTNLKAKSISYGSKRAASSIKYLVFHYTGNKTDTAKANANYFATSNTREAGAHYFVDDTTVYQSIDDLLVAWSVGGSRYANAASTGGGTLYGICTNSNSLSIEMCSTNGVITEKTQENAIALAKTLMKKYNIDINHVCRHFDVTGKSCPGWTGWIAANTSKWDAFKAKLRGTTTSTSKPSSTVTIKTVTAYSVTVTASDGLNCRKEPDANATKIKAYVKGTTLKITKEASNGWGYTGEGWVNLYYTKKVTSSTSTSNGTTTTYYAKYTGTSASIVTALNAIKVDSSYNNRAAIAKLNGISNYTGTAAQNTILLNLLKQGKLIKTKGTTTSTSTTSSTSYYAKYTGTSSSIVDALNAIKVDSSLANRKKIATANGISGYTGTAAQNTKLLSLLKQGKLKKC